MSLLIDTREEIKEGDKILIIDLSLGESRELPAKVIKIRRILGKRRTWWKPNQDIASLWALMGFAN